MCGIAGFTHSKGRRQPERIWEITRALTHRGPDRQDVWESANVSLGAVRLKIIDLEDGMPQVEEARLRMQHELLIARQQGYAAVKLIHGYGSSGVGGSLRIELQKELQRMAAAGAVESFIAGEQWRVSDEKTWELLKRFPEWKRDSDLGKNNKGISLVLL